MLVTSGDAADALVFLRGVTVSGGPPKRAICSAEHSGRLWARCPCGLTLHNLRHTTAWSGRSLSALVLRTRSVR